MDDVDATIHGGLDALTADAPDAPEWSDIERRGVVRRRRRTAVVAVACAVVLFGAIAAIARAGDDDTTVVAGPTGDTIPCGAWIAVRTLFDSSANNQTGPDQALATVTAEQAAFLVKSGDVPDRVARAAGGNPADLASRVVAKPNSNLGTIEITAWAETPQEARRLSDAFAQALLNSMQDIQQREIDRQRGMLDSEIAQLQLELVNVVGDDRAAVALRDRLTSEIGKKQVTLQELDQQAALESNVYSFSSSEAFQVTPHEWEELIATTTTIVAGVLYAERSPEHFQRPAFEDDC